jgi:formate C-acetyltransferase
VRKLVFEERKLSMAELLDALESDYGSKKSTFIRQLLLNSAPKYGNDDNYVDIIAKDLVSALCEILRKHHNGVGSSYAPNIIPTTTHVYFGSLTAATPDGRKSGSPLSEGVSPAQGRDLNGPTSVIKSVTKLPLEQCYGALLNQKFNPTVLSGEDGTKKFADLWRTYFRLGGYHVQFNIVSAETLREAQRNPEAYRHLIVRVAGYSDYFIRLSKDVQDEIISRTDQAPA